MLVVIARCQETLCIMQLVVHGAWGIRKMVIMYNVSIFCFYKNRQCNTANYTLIISIVSMTLLHIYMTFIQLKTDYVAFRSYLWNINEFEMLWIGRKIPFTDNPTIIKKTSAQHNALQLTIVVRSCG